MKKITIFYYFLQFSSFLNFTFPKKYVKMIIENNDIERNAEAIASGIRFLI